MGCGSSQQNSQRPTLERQLTAGSAKLLEKLGEPKIIKSSLSTIFEPDSGCCFPSEEISTADLDVVLLGWCATRVAESSAKMNITRYRDADDSLTMEGFLNDADLVGMPKVLPKSVKIGGASRGRDVEAAEEVESAEKRLAALEEEYSRASNCSVEVNPAFRRSLSHESRASGGSVESRSSRKSQAGRSKGSWKCFVQVGDVHTTLRLWPVERHDEEMPKFSMQNCGRIAFLGLVPVDCADLDSAWSLLSQRLDEIRYFSKVHFRSEAKLGCVPLVTNICSERDEELHTAQPDRLNRFATQCDELGLMDLTDGGGPIFLGDTQCLFEVVVHKVAKWLLNNA